MNIDLGQLITAEAHAKARLSAAKAAALAALVAWIDATTQAITGPVPADERLSWTAKEAAARAVLACRATPEQAVLIADEAAVFGESETALCGKILHNADAWRGIIAALTGIRRRATAAIHHAATPQQAEAALDRAQAEWAAMAQEV
ncbi:hypothetical protein RNZ50_00335 [Paracoccaceae bacterium Fryx2]|nr:hypothetical protein [Paracoccaceae bacterium Fryx2]